MVVYVEWLDARGMRGVQSLAEARKVEGLIVGTAGILVEDDGEKVVIAQDYWSEVEDDGTVPETVRDLQCIPKVLVRRMKKWRIREERLPNTLRGNDAGAK